MWYDKHMSLKTTNRQGIREVPWGMLVWQMPSGAYLTDEDGNFMHVFISDTVNPVQKEKAKKALAEAAAHYGKEEGKPVFWSGKRPVSDEEYEHQLARAKAGLVPDPLDISAIREEEQALHIQND
jgi:hypothetical protein